MVDLVSFNGGYHMRGWKTSAITLQLLVVVAVAM